jgi:hypothetical protein
MLADRDYLNRILVIAGLMSSGQKYEIEELANNLEAKLPRDTWVAAKQMENVLLSVSKQVGNGLVSVNSARLSGVPLKIVQGGCSNVKKQTHGAFIRSTH